MRIVICNKYFFPNGGTERYMEAVMAGLERRGVETVPFSVAYAGSWPSRWERYFLPAPGSPSGARYEHIRLSPLALLRHLDRSLYSLEARRAAGQLADALGRVDAAYILNICNYMSPSIIHAFQARGIPVVVRFGDYHALCANYLFLREGSPCRLCNAGAHYHGLLHRCVKGSLAVSGLRVLAMYLHRMLGVYTGAQGFVAPCRFMRDRLAEGGFPPERIRVIPQPVTFEGQPEPRPKGSHIIYFGRLAPEKGLDTLVRAFQQAAPDLAPDVDLVLAGRSQDGELERLQGMVDSALARRIRFLGFVDKPELSRLVGEALLSVVPSRWYDNAPLAVYESYVHATPVLAADIGGLPEQVRSGETGALFAPGDEADLARKLRDLLADRQGLLRMGTRARDLARTELTMERHLDALEHLFRQLRPVVGATVQTV